MTFLTRIPIQLASREESLVNVKPIETFNLNMNALTKSKSLKIKPLKGKSSKGKTWKSKENPKIVVLFSQCKTMKDTFQWKPTLKAIPPL